MAAVCGLVDVTLLAGSDAAAGNPIAMGISLHRELELRGQAGLRPVEVLSAATMNTARAFRMSGRGRIAAGLRADLLLVRGDPTSDIRTRPLCVYPQSARYTGSGSIDDAANFVCR
jgi:imidazolonepropionase-like amidohydrolase